MFRVVDVIELVMKKVVVVQFRGTTHTIVEVENDPNLLSHKPHLSDL